MKRYIITGSLGHISKPIVEGLLKAGKEVSVITSNSERVKEIEDLGAKALVGSINDAGFVTEAFKGAEVVYTMIPPIWQTENWKASQLAIAKIYADALTANKIQYVVNLSSVGAHLGTGTGPVDAIHDFELMLNKISGLNVIHLRPGFFYYNFLNLIGLVKNAGIIGANYGADDHKLPLVHTTDIAAVALEELLKLDFKNNTVRHITSDIVTGKEVAAALGKAINKEIPWVVFTDDEQRQGLVQGGVPPTHVEGYTAMGAAVRKGVMQELALKEKPDGKVKLADFAKEFAAAYTA